MSKNKLTAIAFAFVLMMSLSAAFVAVPAKGVRYPDRTLGAYIATSPKAVGLGQEMTINLMLWPALEGPTYYTPAQLASFSRFGSQNIPDEQTLESYLNSGYSDCTVTFTRPDGSKDVFKPQDTTLKNLDILMPGLMNNMGTLLFYYKPNMVGTWTASFTYPGETIGNDWYSTLNDTVYYKPAASGISTFEVVADPVNAGILNGWPWSPLPTGYWDRPISINNREWAMISGNYPSLYPDGINYNYNMYSTAPNSPHILWKIGQYGTVGYGGLVGGIWGSWSYNSKVTRSNDPLLWDGKMYITEVNQQYFRCYDLRTGEFLWRSGGAPTFILSIKPPFQTPGQTAGAENTVAAYLVAGWDFYDVSAPDKKLFSFPSSTRLSSISEANYREGSPVVFGTRRTGGWNTTIPLAYNKLEVWKWDLTKAEGNNWMNGLEWVVQINRTAGEYLPGDNLRTGFGRFDEAGVVIVCAAMDPRMVALDMETGAELWRKEHDFVPTNFFYCRDPELLICMDTAIHSYRAFNPKTGQQVWVSDPLMQDYPDWQGMASYYEFIMANGQFTVGSYDGRVYCFDLANGKIKWRSDPIGWSGGYTSETVYGVWPVVGADSQCGADGKLYYATGIVYGAEPFSRFHTLACLDEMTGETLWTIPMCGGQSGAAIADGYYVVIGEDGLFYCFGRGKTETKIELSSDVAAKGTTVLVKGSVLDMSPAQPGTPAVADADQSVWMDYLHMQNATIFDEMTGTAEPGLIFNPPKPNGVSVKLWTVDPNGNAVDIGTVTTDATGLFKKLWAPEIEGEYTIFATFDQTESYWGSEAATVFGLLPAPAAQNGPETPPAPADNTMLIVGSTVAVIIAIAVVGLLLLRKKQ